MIDPADFEKYLQLEAEAEALKQKMILHAEKVAAALFGQGAKITSFWKNEHGSFAGGHLSEDEGCTIPMEMLYAADWEAQVAARHEKQKIRHEKLMALWEKERKQKEESNELKDLERLKKKYPDMV